MAPWLLVPLVLYLPASASERRKVAYNVYITYHLVRIGLAGRTRTNVLPVLV